MNQFLLKILTKRHKLNQDHKQLQKKTKTFLIFQIKSVFQKLKLINKLNSDNKEMMFRKEVMEVLYSLLLNKHLI